MTTDARGDDTGDPAGNVDTPRRSPSDPRSLAFKLNTLIETSPHGLSTRALARALTERGTPVSTSFIGYLRDGRRDNPTYRVIEGLADYFTVPCGFFFDDLATAPLISVLELYQALGDEDIRTVLVEMPKLRPVTRRWLAQQMPALRCIEGGGEATTRS